MGRRSITYTISWDTTINCYQYARKPANVKLDRLSGDFLKEFEVMEETNGTMI